MHTIAFESIPEYDQEVFYSCIAKITNNVELHRVNEVDIKLKMK
jgi:hypothetical protein